jgi:hypothetical protein
MIRILSAIYGGADVKDIVQRNVIDGNSLRLSVDNNTFGDPLVGVAKQLELEIELDGEIIRYVANEGENLEYPKRKYTDRNTLILTSCNRIDQILFAIAVNKEIIKEPFNLVVADCSTPLKEMQDGIRMHQSDDPYNLINDSNYNPNWEMIEEYVKTINKIEDFKIIHVEPRMSKQIGEASLVGLGLTQAAFMGSKYFLKLTGVCHLKYDVFQKLPEYSKENAAITWRRTGFGNQKSTRVFAGRPDLLNIAFMKAGFFGWINEYDFVERKFERIISDYLPDSHAHLDWDETNIIVDEGIGRSDHREILTRNLEKHNLLNSDDPWIRKFINGGIWI